jgi:hypothetical protein
VTKVGLPGSSVGLGVLLEQLVDEEHIVEPLALLVGLLQPTLLGLGAHALGVGHREAELALEQLGVA